MNLNPVNANAEGFKIGIVDVSGVFDKYNKRTDLDQGLKDLEKELQQILIVITHLITQKVHQKELMEK